MIILGTNSIKDTGYNVANSGMFNRADDAFLSKTFSSAGTRTKYTVSAWVKRSGLGTTQTIFSAGTGVNNYMAINFNGADNTLYWQSYSNDGANYDYFLNTTRRFRDPTAWLHVVCAFDSTQGTASNRQKIYINGVQETVFQLKHIQAVIPIMLLIIFYTELDQKQLLQADSLMDIWQKFVP